MSLAHWAIAGWWTRMSSLAVYPPMEPVVEVCLEAKRSPERGPVPSIPASVGVVISRTTLCMDVSTVNDDRLNSWRCRQAKGKLDLLVERRISGIKIVIAILILLIGPKSFKTSSRRHDEDSQLDVLSSA